MHSVSAGRVAELVPAGVFTPYIAHYYELPCTMQMPNHHSSNTAHYNTHEYFTKSCNKSKEGCVILIKTTTRCCDVVETCTHTTLQFAVRTDAMG